MAGYSDTPLAGKLGVTPQSRLVIIGGDLELDDIRPFRRLVRDADVIVWFLKGRADLLKRLAAMQASLTPAGGLWLAWPKRASGVETDLDEHVVREIVLPTGFVDNKVCAIDETWTGMRYVLRKELRPK